MAHRWTNDLSTDDVTPKAAWLNRRTFLAAAAAGSVMATSAERADAQPLKPNSFEDITSYYNFYEFGTRKEDPKINAQALTTSPWSIKIDGMVDAPGDYAIEDVLNGMTIEDRIYRFRCVEAWSMVIPWNGFELADLLEKVGVQEGAKYVAFETRVRPEEMPAQSGFRQPLPWPYVEGLRLDEAMHPLTLMATGIYGEPMPKQNGAPIRLVVPWKYGFKPIKSIVRITLTDKEPPTSWNIQNAREYGFYSNVNPEKDHPRWSQASERRVGGRLYATKIPTLKFKGYESEVAGLYEGMDLQKFF